MTDSSILERYRTHEQIKQGGAISSLNDGIVLTAHGVATRVIAWPGNGFQHESIHVLTLRPGEASDPYVYDMAEEAMVCLKGRGKVLLRGRWVDIEAGDIVFYPGGATRAVRNPAEHDRDFVLVGSISPPQFDLYAAAGYYDVTRGSMDFARIELEKRSAPSGNLATNNEMRPNDSHPELRAWNLSVEEIRREGALFNFYRGAEFAGIDVPMVLVLWPAYGIHGTGFHSGAMAPGSDAARHTHPVSDECIVNWAGSGVTWLGDKEYPTGPLDVVLAPCGVRHGGYVPRDATSLYLPGGFASPPQLDLYLRTRYYKNGRFECPPFSTLAT